ncbi:MAG: TRAP transporter substrate-binding protein [Pseudomonadota bacterium]
MRRQMTTWIAALTTAVAAQGALAQEVTLRFQHFVSPKSANPTYFMAPWAEAIEEQSNGRIKVEIYPFMQLGGKATAMYDLIRDGAVDGGWVIPGYQPGRFPEAEALELPFMAPVSAEASSQAAWKFTQKYLMDDFSDVHIIAAHLHGRGVIHMKGDAATAVSDLDGKRLRGPSRPVTQLLKTIGATPVGMPVPSFPEALAKGVIDGGVIPWEIAPSLKLDELTDSHTEIPGPNSLYNLYFIWAMNKDSYNRLPDDLKAVIDANSGLATSAFAGRAHDVGDAIGKDQIAASGNEIADMQPEEVAKLEALGAELTASWIEEANKKGLDGAALVADAQAFMAEVTGDDAATQ